MLEFLNKWLPEIAAEHGQRLDEMLAYVHWLMLFLFVGWGVYFIFVLFRFRSGRNKQANYSGTKGSSAKVRTFCEMRRFADDDVGSGT